MIDMKLNRIRILKQVIAFIFVVLTLMTKASAQETFIPLYCNDNPEQYFELGGVTMRNNGAHLSTRIENTSPTDELRLDSLAIYSLDFVTAIIHISLSRMDTSYMAEHNSYFVSVGFFNEQKDFLFGHSFCSDYGFSLGGVNTDLQATEMTLTDNGDGHLVLKGKDLLAIHHTFLYDCEEPYEDSQIAYVTVRIMHMGAG